MTITFTIVELSVICDRCNSRTKHDVRLIVAIPQHAKLLDEKREGSMKLAPPQPMALATKY